MNPIAACEKIKNNISPQNSQVNNFWGEIVLYFHVLWLQSYKKLVGGFNPSEKY